MKRRDSVYLGLLSWLSTAALAIYALDLSMTREDYLSNNPAIGIPSGNIILLLALWVAGGAFLATQLARRESDPKSQNRTLFLTTLGVLAVVAIVFAWVKPIAASDPRYYVAYGRQVVMGLNPYTDLLRDYLNDPIMGLVTPMWVNSPCLYGPLGLAPFVAANLISPRDDFFLICSIIRLLYVPMLMLMGWFLYKSWSWSRYPFTFTFAVLGNPIFLHMALNCAHVEIWMMFWLLAVCLSMASDRPLLAALALTAACCTKIVPIVLIPVYLCWWFRKGIRQTLVFFLTFAVIHGSIYWALNGADYPGVLRSPNGWNNLAVTGGPVIRTFLAFSFSENDASRYALYGFFLVGGAFCLSILRSKREFNPYAVTSITLALLYFFRTTCTSWYTLWFWPFLWLAYRKERNTAISIVTWTASVLIARGIGWTGMIWLFTFAYSHNLWLLWKERRGF